MRFGQGMPNEAAAPSRSAVSDRPTADASDYSGPGVEAEIRVGGPRAAADAGGPRSGVGGPPDEGGDGYVTLYTARAFSTDGAGRVTTEDGVLDLPVKAPRELGGPGGAPNPEQLLAAAYATCFHNSLALVAGREGVSTADCIVETAVELRKRGKHDDYAIGVEVVVSLPGVDRDLAGRLVRRAHEHCPYSKALRGNLQVGARLA
ncbi:Ohr family peroxiredoxin [Streptosporangium sandarakinum]|uniref:Ohr subfamily peroxiredoxin n=1 Tax=Streptosporangium sandarakinum TaxID=1260955 RepID=A0A852UUE4_9ACTN|nr:Ohr family peroxiredoxin [Streptosporangium sandarakinum]NYF39136.1 Ohr subfamily peroxiredoxin [Streptosporangium sandarakinum]